MAKYMFKEVTKKLDWEDFVSQDHSLNFLHSWNYGDFHEMLGKTVFRRAAVDEQGVIQGVYQAIIEDSRRGRYMTVVGGPILDWSNKDLVETVIADIRATAVPADCVFVRIRPQLERSDDSLGLFKSLGLHPAPMHLSVEHAGVLDISKSEAEILADASQGLRRKIRKAQKQDLEIRVRTDNEAAKEFAAIHQAHAQRQEYVAFSEDYIVRQFEAFAKDNQVAIYEASKDGQVLAMNMMIFYGPEASYHYGVSTDEGVRLSSAPLLHLKAMEDARHKGIGRYNFWGIVEPDQTNHRFYGVSQFKRSFGVTDLRYLPAHDLIVKRLPYLKNWLIETIRRHRRHL